MKGAYCIYNGEGRNKQILDDKSSHVFRISTDLFLCTVVYYLSDVFKAHIESFLEISAEATIQEAKKLPV